jgi:choline dehydrogenase-like flavoprotein
MAHFLSDEQFRTLTAICDTLIPEVKRDPDPYGFWGRAASDLEAPRHFATRVRGLPGGEPEQFRRLLDALSHPHTSALLTGQWRAFADLPPETRERLLQRWAVSPRGDLRQLFQAFKRLTGALFYSITDEARRNPNWPVFGYHLPPAPVGGIEGERRIQPLGITQDTTLDCDVVVVGSGAGGGVAAGELARAGKDVIVLDKGGYYAEPDFDGAEYSSVQKMYESTATADNGIVVLAGSGLGGGTTVNWAASFRTPPHVLEEWEREYLCPGLTGPEFQASLDAVSERLLVNLNESEPGPESLALERGCTALGYHCGVVPRNVRGCGSPPRCGWCGYGCPYGAKLGTVKTYLQDAAECGARFVVNAECEKVLIEDGRAVGVVARVGEHSLRVRARVVVIAAGTLHSPAILLRSGLANPNIGLNLRLHPTVCVYGQYAEPIEPWTGVPISRYSDQFENLDGRHYGVKLEHPPAHPGFLGLALPWRSGVQHKDLMSHARHLALFIVITRDRGAGRVTLDQDGRSRLTYRLSRDDARHLGRGLAESFRIHAAAGATEIGGPHSGIEPYRVGSDLEAYLRRMQALSCAPNQLVLLAAHQMGTCRMGGLRSQSVLDPQGQSWDVRNLFVADASTFPTPSGVNPMLTVMAVAHQTAQQIKARV